MDKLTDYYPDFEVVGLKKSKGRGCVLICEEYGYECKICPIQEAFNKLYRLEHNMEIPNYGTLR